ncbi:MAG: hypothetical protein RMJ88_05065 [Thermogemmata sp.]|nr:hypothetical protein [Thermogemmata sp.]
MLTLDFEVVDLVRRWTRLDGNDGGDLLQPGADSFAFTQLPRLDELVPVLAPERVIGRATDLVIAHHDRQQLAVQLMLERSLTIRPSPDTLGKQ